MQYDKPKRYKSPKYLSFVRSLPCCICSNEAEPHHLRSVGSGGSDLTCIPLCRKHHSEIEQIGKSRFCEKHVLDPWYWNAYILATYIEKILGEE